MEPVCVGVLEKWNQCLTASGRHEPIGRSASRDLADFSREMRLVVVAGVERERRPIEARRDARLREHLTNPRHAREHLRRHADVARERTGQMLPRYAEGRGERRDGKVSAGTQDRADCRVDRTVLALGALEPGEEQPLERGAPSAERRQLSTY